MAPNATGPGRNSMATDPTLTRTTERIQRLYAKRQSNSVSTAREIGDLLDATRARLGARRYGRWVREEICIPKSSLKRFRDVAALFREDPKLAGRHIDLGATNLARLYRVQADAREEALAASPVPLCSIETGLFAKLTRPYLAT